MDPLSKALRGLRLIGFVHSRNVFTAPWGFHVPRPDKVTAAFYAVTAGCCWIEADGIAPTELCAGDVCWIVGAVPHCLRDDPATPARSIHEILTPEQFARRGGVTHGGRGAATTFVCGAFLLDDPEIDAMLAPLPRLICIDANCDSSHRIQAIIETLDHEAASLAPGSQATLEHLAEALFTYAVRTHAQQPRDRQAAWLTALSDPFIGPVLANMKQHPQQPWTVQSLARTVRMSRSAFSARFTSLVGTPPLKHLKTERMARARRLLADTRSPLKQIAIQSGYTSEAAFNTAFKHEHGMAPGAYRRAHHATGDASLPLGMK